jgi:AmiR/NasT family two-component response regulator
MASRSLAILVIDENRIRASIIEAGLRETGHDKITVVHDITGIARTIAEVNPDVIVIDLENPGDRGQAGAEGRLLSRRLYSIPRQASKYPLLPRRGGRPAPLCLFRW